MTGRTCVGGTVAGDHGCVTPARRQINEMMPRYIRDHLQGRAGGVILDVGCGDGEALELLAESLPSGHYLGIDLVEHSGWAPRRAAPPPGWTAEFAAHDVYELEQLQAAAGVTHAITISAFEHFPDDVSALQVVRRAMGPRAVMVLCVPAAAGRTVWGPRHGFHWYRRQDLEQRARDAGWEIAELEQVGGIGSWLLGLVWFVPAFLLSKVTFRALLLVLRDRARVQRRFPWVTLTGFQFAHCRFAAGRRFHHLMVDRVVALDVRFGGPATAWIAVLRTVDGAV
jgi:SAM-dependent methyltransferase